MKAGGPMGWARRRSKATYGAVVTLTAMLAGGTVVMPAAAQSASTALPEAAVTAAAEQGEAPSEDLAKAAAKQSGRPVEATNLRDERRDVFANADGSFTAREYTQPVRAQQGDRWVPVDDTLVKKSDGTWVPKAATVDLVFSDGGQGPFARMSRVGREYALTWPGGALSKPVVEGNTARYAEVLPGVDLTVRAGTEGFSHYFVVKTAEAAANPQLDTLELGLSTKGLTASETPDGGLEVVDSAVGGAVFESAGAAMWESSTEGGTAAARTARAVTPAKPALDAADGGRKAVVGIDVAKGKLSLKPDLKLLRGKSTNYPVVIDPTPRTTSRTAWTSVMSGMPSEQDWAYADDAGVGRCPSDQTPASCSGIGVRRGLFSFPMSFYKGKQILSSTFSARLVKNYWNDNKAEPIDLYRIGGQNYTVTSSSDWNSTSGSWTNYLLTVDRAITPTSCGSQANLHFSNGGLLTDTKAAAAGGWTAMSLGLRAKDESAYAGWKRICGNAYLSITYNTPPLQVSNATMTSDPGGKCVTDATKAPWVDGLPMLRAEARDPDHTSTSSDPVKMQFQVFYRDAKNVETSYFAETGYKSPNTGTLFSHQVTSPEAKTGVGMYYPAASPSPMVYQRTTPDAGPNTANIPFDAKGRKILVGDWNADGIDTLGTYDATSRTFELWNDNSFTNPTRITYGITGDIPVVGDWNGDGRDTVGVWRPSNHYFYLNNETSNNVTDISFVYGAGGMTPIVGDWNGDGVDTIGMYYPTNITFYIRNYNSAGGNSYEMRYGSPGDQPVIGDWNGDKTDSIGVWRESNHYYYLNNEHANNVADISFVYGADGMVALSGTWMPGIPTNTTISWQARAYDGEAWGPWSSANGAGRCVVRRDATVPSKPVVTAAHYAANGVWHDGIGTEDTFTFAAVDGDVTGYRYTIDDVVYPPKATTAGAPVQVKWTPTWSGRHYVEVEAYDGAGKTSALASYSFRVANGRVAQWDLADPAGTTSPLDAAGDIAAVPGTGVTFGTEGRGGKSDPVAHFDGTPEAYISAADPTPDAADKAIVDTQSSFSVSAWVKSADLTKDMAVVSQDGTDEAGFELGYNSAKNSWSFATPDADGEATTRWAALVPAGSDALNKWVHLTGVFDAKAVGGPQLRLYVDDGDPATPTATATAARTTTWAAQNAFQIGRSLSKGQYGKNLNGDVSQVRVYNRPVTTDEITAFQTVRPVRKGYWSFEQPDYTDAVPNVQSTGQPLMLRGAPTVYRRVDRYDPKFALSGVAHVELNGTDEWAETTAPVVGGDKSFTLSARVRLTNVTSTTSQTVLSLPGQNTDRLVVRYDGIKQRWQVVMTAGDSTTANKVELRDENTLPIADGNGSHVAVVYDAVVRELRLYVDGGEPVSTRIEDNSYWAATGGLQVGRAKSGQYLSGAVDEVRVYDGALDRTVISMVSDITPESAL
ncbi:LamG-like jellyroll fold domain-containing protein [Streptomyces sp. NPDC013740]|uniref:LamG-like jellyroll fold domain-containing protein n=1 Tax=Streptomyces sp. NPDC013740 TaxID=3364867 RepID=UPI00370289E5